MLLWTTFTSDQIDIDVQHPEGDVPRRRLSTSLHAAGIRAIRLDAVGYAVKKAGTQLLHDSRDVDVHCRAHGDRRTPGMEVLVEVHGHYQDQIDVARSASTGSTTSRCRRWCCTRCYRETSRTLTRWLEIRPTNAVTVLDTHDGIGVKDVAALTRRPARARTARRTTSTRWSRRSTSAAAARAGWPAATRRATSTCPRSTARSTTRSAADARLPLARADPVFVPGIPQIYYVGLLAGGNDIALLARTGVGRDVNRHEYSPHEVGEQLERPLVRAILAALRLRTRHPAFEGRCEHTISRSVIAFSWRHGTDLASLRVDTFTSTFLLCWTSGRETVEIADVESLAGPDVIQLSSPAQKGSR